MSFSVDIDKLVFVLISVSYNKALMILYTLLKYPNFKLDFQGEGVDLMENYIEGFRKRKL